MSIPRNSRTVSTYNLTAGCCTNPGDCTQTTPEHAMTVINIMCEGSYSCTVTIQQAILPECNYTQHNYQEVIYSCGTPAAGRILQYLLQ